MKVLKFGGSSVGDAKAIKQTAQIIIDSKDVAAVVLSAIRGVTDMLINMAQFAGDKNIRYEDLLRTLESIHHDTLDDLIPDSKEYYHTTKNEIH